MGRDLRQDYRAAVTVDGDTQYVVRSRTVRVPADREAQALAAVTGLAALILAGALVWSTVSIGGLLSLAAPQWVSYMIAAVFDAAWIGCLALEWVYRYDRTRSALPQRAGWLALALSMALITAHGYVHHWLYVGIAGAAVSLVAKSFWAVVMKSTSVELDQDTQDWMAAKNRAAHARLAVVAATRTVTRVQARADAEAAVLSGPGPDPVREQDVSGPVRVPVPSGPVPIGKATDLSIRVRDLVASGRSEDEIRTVVRSEFPEAKADTVNKRIKRTIHGA